VLNQTPDTLSGGRRRRVELARILFAAPDTMILDEPTNHLDAESVLWLRDYLKTYDGGLVIISHDLDLIDEVVNKVFFLDANRQSTRLNSSHVSISYAVFCLKKKKKKYQLTTT